MTEADLPSPAIKLWDLPVRVVHWAFVLLLPALWWTGEQGDLELHMKIGYVLLALLLFRLMWGVIGSAPARFASFVKGPGAIARYLRGEGGKVVGHNPIGALSVIALLGMLAVQIGLGLIAENDDMEGGPLRGLVSYETNAWAADMHELGFNVLLGLIALHLAAIVYYRVIRRDDLLTPMVTGKRRYDAPVEAPAMAPLWRAGVAAVIALSAAWWISLGAPL